MESAKLLIIILIVALIILIVGAAIWFGWGGTGAEWYSQIDNSCVKEVAASDDMVYEYTLVCYDADGRSRDISFKTSRILTEDAFILLETMPLRGVVSWAEVFWEDLPPAVQEQYPGPQTPSSDAGQRDPAHKAPGPCLLPGT